MFERLHVGGKVGKEWAYVFEALRNMHRAVFLTVRNGKICIYYLLYCTLCKYNRPHCFLHFDRIVRRGSRAKRITTFRSTVLKQYETFIDMGCRKKIKNIEAARSCFYLVKCL